MLSELALCYGFVMHDVLEFMICDQESDVKCLLKHVFYLLEIRLRKLVDEREKMIEQVGQ